MYNIPICVGACIIILSGRPTTISRAHTRNILIHEICVFLIVYSVVDMKRVSRISDVYWVYFHYIVYARSVCSIREHCTILSVFGRMHGDSFGVRHSFSFFLSKSITGFFRICEKISCVQQIVYYYLLNT